MNDIPEAKKFRCRVNNKYDEIVAYNDIVDFIEQEETWGGLYRYLKILKYKKVKPGDPDYKGCMYNVQILWETGEITWEPLHTKDKTGVWDTDPVAVAIFARENGLLDTPGWHLGNIKALAKTQKRMIRVANQAKLRSWREKPKYMYGFLVPQNYAEAVQIDKENGNTKWQDCTKLELDQIDEYDT